MFEKKIQIQNKAGIHCRPSSLIMGEVEKFPGHEFKLESERGTSSLTSILDLLALGLQCGDIAVLTVSGPQEQEAGSKVAGLLEFEFDFH
ncbi:MAG: HPr family phosphocarrier protein [Lentisphaeria bacterium]|nr:HPr family phosphocarrier protein [Lentisphaeria bacterium]